MSYFGSDLILLHAPSVYDFRKKAIMYGPISDVIPSTPVFEMYPIGFSSLVEYLAQRGYRTRILNLAYRMLQDKSYDVEKAIKRLNAKAFGIDLHWLPHAHGSLEIARMCKKYHPDKPVIFGGYSASYFHQELVAYPEVDYVLKGDSTEESLAALLDALKQGDKDLSHISNLTWKDQRGIHANPLKSVTPDLNRFSNNYLTLFKSALRYGDIKGYTSIHDWWNYPIAAIMTCRGCVHNCVFCGGSKYGVNMYCERKTPSFRAPQLVAKDIQNVVRYTNGPIFVVGDLRQAGEDYARILLEYLEKVKPANQIVLELFTPAPKKYFEMVARAIPNFNFEFSPESHLEEVRRSSGKTYSNAALEETIGNALECGCKKFDLFFMFGLPYQTPEKALGTVDYCEELLKKFGTRLNPFISPLAPFIDPGSLAYEESDKFGYKIFYRTLEEHRQALVEPSWKYTLSYETKWMTRDEIVETTYQAALRLNHIKSEFGLINPQVANAIDDRIKEAKVMMGEIDEIVKEKDENAREERLMRLKPRIDQLSMDTICEADEIKWPAGKRRFNYLNIARDILFKK
jgi:B12-binding domain/radical SAM domain protein